MVSTAEPMRTRQDIRPFDVLNRHGRLAVPVIALLAMVVLSTVLQPRSCPISA